MKHHFSEFGGGLNHQIATFQQMKSWIHDLEEKLKFSHHITPKQKAGLENALAQAMADRELVIQEIDDNFWDKAKDIRVHEIT